jgi:hypothetical protein
MDTGRSMWKAKQLELVDVHLPSCTKVWNVWHFTSMLYLCCNIMCVGRGAMLHLHIQGSETVSCFCISSTGLQTFFGCISIYSKKFEFDDVLD